MITPKTYPPIGRCIYCGANLYSNAEPAKKLGDEHIIPLAFGGNLLLPEASCQKCERITSGIETHCIEQMVRDNREHLGLRARRHKRNRMHLPVSVDRGTGPETIKVTARRHPGILIMFEFDPPRLLFGEPDAEGAFVGRVSIRPLVDDLRARIDEIGGSVNSVRRGGFDALIFGRMLAKVAHSYAVAELGEYGFRTLLTDLIRGEPTQHASQLVGGEWGSLKEPGASGSQNEISVALHSGLHRDYYVVRLRLFSALDMPIYLIVVGEPLNQQP